MVNSIHDIYGTESEFYGDTPSHRSSEVNLFVFGLIKTNKQNRFSKVTIPKQFVHNLFTFLFSSWGSISSP